MDYESICGSLQTISMARLFYEYGKLDRLLERGITTSSDDLYEIYYELLIAATDYPKDVPGIALSYQHIAAQLNEEAVGELASRYTALCHERDRLLHYIGLLDKRQQDVIRKHYFEQQSWSEIAASMDLTPRTVQRTRQQALDELANLYAFADGILRR